LRQQARCAQDEGIFAKRGVDYDAVAAHAHTSANRHFGKIVLVM
jgi:hypothetical protein